MGGSVRFIFGDLNRSRGFGGLRRGSVCGHFYKWFEAMSILIPFSFAVVLLNDEKLTIAVTAYITFES